MTTIEVLSVNIHPSYQYLLCCTTEGFQSYYLQPFKCIVTRLILGGIRLGVIQVLNESEQDIQTNPTPNTISRYFLIGTGKNTIFPNNRVVIWNDSTNQVETEISINTTIRSLKLVDDQLLAILCARKLFIYDLPSICLRKSIDLLYQKISYQLIDTDPYLCYQPLQLGELTTEIYTNIPNRTHQFPTYSSGLQQIAMSPTGKYIATISHQGVVVKLFNSLNGELIKEFRRGLVSKEISFLGFSTLDKWIICGTVEGSVHLFPTKSPSPSYTSGWGILRPKSKFCLRINHRVDNVYLNDPTSLIYIISGNKFYSGRFTDDDYMIENSQLLVHHGDPFSLSPKLRKKTEIPD